MSRTFLTGVLLFGFASCIYGQDESELARFQSFFSKKQSQPLEQALHDEKLNLEQAREIGDRSEEAEALRNLGLIHMNRVPDYEKALDLFVQALAIEDSLEREAQQVLTYIAIARVFEVVGDYYKSAQFLEQALVLNRDRMSINTLALILNRLGKVNASRGNMEQALGNYKQVLRYSSDIDKPFEADAHFNLAHLYTMQGDYQAALESHKRALALIRSFGDKPSEAQSLNDIGVLYSMMRNDEKSLANHLAALEVRRELGDKRGIAESYNNIGLLHFRKGNAPEGISNGLLALGNAREAQEQDQIFKSYDLLSQSYKNLADYKNALMYRELSLAIHEFIQSEKQERQLLETQNRYVLGKKEAEIQKLDALRVEREQEIAAQKKFSNILFLAVALALVTAGLLLILYLVKRRSNRILNVARKEVQKQNEKLQELNHTKDKFFSIISHDLKGPLNSLTSFSRLLIDHTDRLSKEEIQLLAKDLDKSVKNLLTLLENLLEWSRSQTGSIDFSGEEFNLSELLESNMNLLESQAKNKQISVLIEHPGEMVVRLHKHSINTVVRNLISNAIKFTPAGGTIRVTLKVENAKVNISVADNGVGMTPEVMGKLFSPGSKHSTKGTANEKGTGLGLILCREFVERNDGAIHVQSTPGKGSIFTVSFPSTVCAKPISMLSEPVSF